MGRVGHTVALGVAAGCLLGVVALSGPAGGAGAQVPLPPPPTLPPATAPDEAEPLLAVAGPTAGPACGTASLLTLLAPSIAEGYFKIPFSSLLDSDTFRSYGNTALYVCGFVPFPLTPSQCEADRQILDALRGLNPLAAQVVGLFPQGATVDTVLALQGLLPSGPSVATPLADELSALMTCTRPSGVPPTPDPTTPAGMPAVDPAPVPGGGGSPLAPGSSTPAFDAGDSSGAGGATPSATGSATGAAPAAATQPSVGLPDVFETRFLGRSGIQWLGILLGLLLLGWSLWAWRSTPRETA